MDEHRPLPTRAWTAGELDELEVDEALRVRYGNDSGVHRMTSGPAREATLRVLPLA